jgi:8-oxo-dGTP diphosphatase
MEKDELKIGINPIILNDKGQVLLGKRLKKVGYGTYAFPGGHLELNETIEEGAIREVQEETGLIAKLDDVEVVNVSRTNDWIHFGVLIKKYIGEPENCEPENCGDLSFFNFNNLPILFFGSKVTMELYLKSKFYDKDINVNSKKD